MNSPIQPWPKLASTDVGDFRIFRIRSEKKVSPRTALSHDFFVIDCVDWVNVIAITRNQEMVLVEQYRHGSNTVELEIPGGMIDPQDADPGAAGARELREETGFAGDPAKVIGRVYPNPAIQSNSCYTVLVENCQCVHPTEWDHGEDMATRLVPVQELPGLVAKGQIRHSLVVAAVYFYQLWQAGKAAAPVRSEA